MFGFRSSAELLRLVLARRQQAERRRHDQPGGLLVDDAAVRRHGCRDRALGLDPVGDRRPTARASACATSVRVTSPTSNRSRVACSCRVSRSSFWLAKSSTALRCQQVGVDRHGLQQDVLLDHHQARPLDPHEALGAAGVGDRLAAAVKLLVDGQRGLQRGEMSPSLVSTCRCRCRSRRPRPGPSDASRSAPAAPARRWRAARRVALRAEDWSGKPIPGPAPGSARWRRSSYCHADRCEKHCDDSVLHWLSYTPFVAVCDSRSPLFALLVAGSVAAAVASGRRGRWSRLERKLGFSG